MGKGKGVTCNSFCGLRDGEREKVLHVTVSGVLGTGKGKGFTCNSFWALGDGEGKR